MPRHALIDCCSLQPTGKHGSGYNVTPIYETDGRTPCILRDLRLTRYAPFATTLVHLTIAPGYGEAATFIGPSVRPVFCCHRYFCTPCTTPRQTTDACTVFLFTFALFLSGYVLQQRYVHSLQAAIKPRLPKPLPAAKPIEPPTLDAKWARPVGSRPEVDEYVQQMMAAPTLDWARLGYVQVAREHGELCSAIMLLADLQQMKSPAKRVLMFPRVWLKDTNEDEWNPQMSTTMRLLRTAARRYGVTLMPMETIVENADGMPRMIAKQSRLVADDAHYRFPSHLVLSRKPVFPYELRKAPLPRGTWRSPRCVSAGFSSGLFGIGANGRFPGHA